MKTLRIVFTVLCAACLLAVFPVGTFLDFGYALPILVLAGVFFLAMLFCKNKQEQKERREAEPEPDFLNSDNEEKKD